MVRWRGVLGSGVFLLWRSIEAFVMGDVGWRLLRAYGIIVGFGREF